MGPQRLELCAVARTFAVGRACQEGTDYWVSLSPEELVGTLERGDFCIMQAGRQSGKTSMAMEASAILPETCIIELESMKVSHKVLPGNALSCQSITNYVVSKLKRFMKSSVLLIL